MNEIYLNHHRDLILSCKLDYDSVEYLVSLFLYHGHLYDRMQKIWNIFIFYKLFILRLINDFHSNEFSHFSYYIKNNNKHEFYEFFSYVNRMSESICVDFRLSLFFLPHTVFFLQFFLNRILGDYYYCLAGYKTFIFAALFYEIMLWVD